MEVFSKQACTLGEGPLWSDYYQQFFWVDIIEQKIYAKSLLSNNEYFDKCWPVDFIPTALIDNSLEDKTIWVVADKGLFIFEPQTGVAQKHIDFELDENFRTNDAGVDESGNLWVGVMEKQPSGLNGYIFTVDQVGNIKKGINKIGIPNTFCWSDEQNAMLVSDSFQQKTFLVKNPPDEARINEYPVVLDLADTDGTPDGGALDQGGGFWNANWGLKRVISHQLGRITRKLDIDVPHVTSVCFGDKNRDKLLVTTATEGLNESQREAYPQSGFTFLLNNDKEINGRTPLGFAMKVQRHVS
ncbi:gluconolactonase [Idiomarina aquatica]|uniref:Gluconolactonase n=1 Tax=Idiomarina aquatica TaxID=1327752 RepID=A0A4R6PQV4_9GAMM|nr:SMP-30/gluconolactonase/LRE family protein [Idiomarina aquatica]TDP40211.1 gluconolactonase [Idiomarina aquatica]